MIEQAIRYELNRIQEIHNKIYPTNAPEGCTGPYLVYSRINTKKIKTLTEITESANISYMISVMAVSYADMMTVRDKVEAALINMAQTSIGDKDKVYIKDIDINNIDEVYEFQLGVNRGIIDFTLYI